MLMADIGEETKGQKRQRDEHAKPLAVVGFGTTRIRWRNE